MSNAISSFHAVNDLHSDLAVADDVSEVLFQRTSVSGSAGALGSDSFFNDGVDANPGDRHTTHPSLSGDSGQNNNPAVVGAIIGWAIGEILNGIKDLIGGGKKPEPAPPAQPAAPAPPAPPAPPPPAPTPRGTTVFV